MTFRRFYSRIVLAFLFLVVISIFSCGDETVVVPPDPGGDGVDTIPPAVVLGLHTKYPTASTIALVWISPGDDGLIGQAASYDLRHSLSIITEQNWESATPVPGLPAPKPAGNIETVVATGLPSSTTIYFALKTIDEAQNVSSLSNNTIDTTLAETLPPAALTDLKAIAISDTEFKLTWTAPGDDYMAGTATAYDIRHFLTPITTNSKWNNATQVIGEPAPSPGGSPDSFIVTGLGPDTNYHFAIKTVDEVNNWSGLSNVCPGMALSNLLWVSPLRVDNLEDVSVSFRASATERTKILIWHWAYVSGVGWKWSVFRHLVNDMLPEGIYTETWDTTDDNGNPVDSTWPSEQFKMKLYYGTAEIDSADVKVNL